MTVEKFHTGNKTSCHTGCGLKFEIFGFYKRILLLFFLLAEQCERAWNSFLSLGFCSFIVWKKGHSLHSEWLRALLHSGLELASLFPFRWPLTYVSDEGASLQCMHRDMMMGAMLGREITWHIISQFLVQNRRHGWSVPRDIQSKTGLARFKSTEH